MADGRDRDSKIAVGLGIGAGLVAGGILGGLAYLISKDKLEESNSSNENNSSERRLAVQTRNERVRSSEENETLATVIGVGAGLVGGILAGGITRGLTNLMLNDDDDDLDINQIGVNFNKWRIPRSLSRSEIKIATQFAEAGKAELDMRTPDWKRASEAVDKVLDLLMVEIQKEARSYEGLVIGNYVKQGSSREGLKVFAADEFDVLLQYHFDGFQYEVELLESGGYTLPELACLRIYSTISSLSRTHPKLYKKGVFNEEDGQPYLNTRNLQEKVFRAMIASASSVVQRKVNNEDYPEAFEFKIRIRLNPPSVNITIELTDEKDGQIVFLVLDSIQIESVSQGTLQGASTRIIDVDIVPGLMLYEDRVPDPTNNRRTMSCPRYAVFKWLTEDARSAARYDANPALLWRVCSSGYEKHVIDIAQGKKHQQFIVNSLRILKLYFRNMKKGFRPYPPPQVVTVLRSYHLKHIALYCILYLRVLNKLQISGVEVTLAYMLAFLGVCLKEKRLPHFFHANQNISRMFPEFRYDKRFFRYDLFQGKVDESFNQALLSFQMMRRKLAEIIEAETSECMDALVSDEIVEQFRSYVIGGIYYKKDDFYAF